MNILKRNNIVMRGMGGGRRSELIDAKGIPRKCQSISNLFNNFDDFPNSDSFALISQHETAHLWEILE